MKNDKLMIQYKGYWIEQAFTVIEKGIKYYIFKPCDKNNKKLPKAIRLSQKQLNQIIDQELANIGLSVKDVDADYLDF